MNYILIKVCQIMNQLPFLCYSDLCELEENRQRARSLDSLQIALRTQPNSFVARLVWFVKQ